MASMGNSNKFGIFDYTNKILNKNGNIFTKDHLLMFVSKCQCGGPFCGGSQQIPAKFFSVLDYYDDWPPDSIGTYPNFVETATPFETLLGAMYWASYRDRDVQFYVSRLAADSHSICCDKCNRKLDSKDAIRYMICSVSSTKQAYSNVDLKWNMCGTCVNFMFMFAQDAGHHDRYYWEPPASGNFPVLGKVNDVDPLSRQIYPLFQLMIPRGQDKVAEKRFAHTKSANK